MKQLAVISGKGGTGKTTIVAAFASLAQDAVMADCDVDAADLHLILKPELKSRMDFTGLKVASVDPDMCEKCGTCRDFCRFDAITEEIEVIDERCEGCGVCEFVCPTGAMKLVDRKTGVAYLSETRFGPMSHATLDIAAEATGKLVTLVRENAKALAEESGRDLIIIDGPPGIGCPVIATVTGVDAVLIVTEPTISGMRDMERVLEFCRHFGIPSSVCINKYDINEELTEEIEKLCKQNGLRVVGKLPYDNVTTESMIEGKSVVEYSDGKLSQLIKDVWSEVLTLLQ